MSQHRLWTDLVCKESDTIDWLKAAASSSPSPAEILPSQPEAGRRVLEWLQVSTRSPLGAVAFYTGGIWIGDGWLRILGAGSELLPRALDTWNELGARNPGAVLVADDVLGGFFAWAEATQTILYLAPDTAQWEDTELGYHHWLESMLSSSFADYYQDLRWPCWKQTAGDVDGDKGLLVLPPVWADGPAYSERQMAVVPIEELWALALKAEKEIGGLPDGAQVTLAVTDD